MIKKNILCILIVVWMVSCHQQVEKGNYAENPAISDKQGQPHDSLTFYYPTTIKKDSLEIKTVIDSSTLDYYSCVLYNAHEPVLFNYYLGHVKYRFLWLRSKDRPVIFTLTKVGRKIWLTTKVLDKQPQLNDRAYVKPHPIRWDKWEIDSVVKADRKASIVINTTKKLSKKDWNDFTALVDKCSFWDTEPYTRSKEFVVFDGSEWVIEGHVKSKYWFVSKCSPHDNFRELGLFLIDKSELKERVY
jgi:hypothetical protein